MLAVLVVVVVVIVIVVVIVDVAGVGGVGVVEESIFGRSEAELGRGDDQLRHFTLAHFGYSLAGEME